MAVEFKLVNNKSQNDVEIYNHVFNQSLSFNISFNQFYILFNISFYSILFETVL